MREEASRILIVGAGAFGTALALVLRSAGKRTVLYARDAKAVDSMRSSRENAAHLPGISLPADLVLTADEADAQYAELVLLAVPAQSTRSAAEMIRPHIKQSVPIIACAKGLELHTGFRQTQIIADVLPSSPIAVLSGPSLATEIAEGKPTLVSIAAKSIRLAEVLRRSLSTEALQVRSTDDVVGVELCGAAKNVIALACGIVIGANLGEGAAATLMARGLREIEMLGLALGAQAETFMGPAGIADLIVACTSMQSRNLAFGIGFGRDLDRTGVPRTTLLGVPEGVNTAPILAELARNKGVAAAILIAVASIVANRDELTSQAARRLLF
jgi:glycerol-3-phosphate dehydrogenase (NAD(P)+)